MCVLLSDIYIIEIVGILFYSLILKRQNSKLGLDCLNASLSFCVLCVVYIISSFLYYVDSCEYAMYLVPFASISKYVMVHCDNRQTADKFTRAKNEYQLSKKKMKNKTMTSMHSLSKKTTSRN